MAPTGSLDNRTQLVGAGQLPHRSAVPYVLTTIYPDAGEAVVCVVVPKSGLADVDHSADAGQADPAAGWERANRRARSRSRRYITSNRLRFMWVLTFAGGGLHGPQGRQDAMAAVAVLVRRLRVEHGLGAYWYSPELHPDGHGWHVNLFVGRYLRHSAVEQAWGEGYVWAKDWTRDSRVQGRPFLEKLRHGAGYGAKYAAKDWDSVQLAGGAHRYEVAEGFEPTAVVAFTVTLDAGLAVATDYFGGRSFVWRSADQADWEGPPCAVLFAATARGSP